MIELEREEAQQHAVEQHDRGRDADDEERREERRVVELERDEDRDRDDVRQHDRGDAAVAQEVERQPGERAPGGQRGLGRALAAQPRVRRAQRAC